VKILKKFGIFLLCLTFYSTLYAIDKKAGTRGFQFLRIGIGARQISMGETSCAVAGDVNTIFWNPAGLSQIKEPGISFSHNQWFADISEQSIIGNYPTKLGNFGVGILYLHMDEFTGYDIDSEGEPVRIPNFTAYDVAGIFSYSRSFWNVPTGFNLKIFQEKLEDKKVNGIAMDAGFLCKTPIDNLSMGLSIQNIGKGVKFIDKTSSLPLNVKYGIAYQLLKDTLLLVADINKPVDNELEGSFGVEYDLGKILALRAGYNTGNDFDSGIAAGVGLVIADWIVDYAYVPYGKLGNTQRISISAKFGKLSELKATAKELNERERKIADEKKTLEKIRQELNKEKLTIERKRQELVPAKMALEGLIKERGITVEKEEISIAEGDTEKIKIAASEEAIYFGVNSVKINTGSYKVLNKIANFLLKMSEYKVEVKGHSDNQGDPVYNQQLSEKRAENIKQHLIEKGVLKENISSKGYGDTEPIASNDIKEGRGKNRRVEFIITRLK